MSIPYLLSSDRQLLLQVQDGGRNRNPVRIPDPTIQKDLGTPRYNKPMRSTRNLEAGGSEAKMLRTTYELEKGPSSQSTLMLKVIQETG